MTPETLSTFLAEQFSPAAADDLDVRVTFRWADGACQIAIRDNRLITGRETAEHAGSADAGHGIEEQSEDEMVIYLESSEQLVALIQGAVNPVEAFMSGTLRSNGYLMWVFRVLGAFRRG